jgi:cephalosporin hydroxylase
MQLIIDTEAQNITVDGVPVSLYSREAFEVLSDLWVKVGWTQRYSYFYSWMGRPIIQLPQDMMRIQEAIYSLKPDVIVETGIAHGGSLIFYASLCKAMGHGRVIGVDIQIHEANRKLIEGHELAEFVTLIEGDSVAPDTLIAVKSHIADTESVMVILDSAHNKRHVSAELEAYGELVTLGSLLIAADGIMARLDEVPQGKQEWAYDNPLEAVADFVTEHPEFAMVRPRPPFQGNELKRDVTYWLNGWLRRVRAQSYCWNTDV